MIYLIGSMRNPRIPEIAIELRQHDYDVFDEWYCTGAQSDEKWQAYERQRGRSYKHALAGAHAQDVFHFDKRHLEQADTVVLVMPAGRSGHLEIGWALGQGKRGIVLLDGEPDRYDIMLNFATAICESVDELIKELACPSIPTNVPSVVRESSDLNILPTSIRPHVLESPNTGTPRWSKSLV